MDSTDPTDSTGDVSSGRSTSLWLATTGGTDYDPLDGDLTVDSAVVGGGIAGLTAATLLAEAGQEVALIERDRIVSGVTARSTAKVTAQHGRRYADLVSEFGTERARQYAEANQAAVEAVAERAESFDADCGFRRAKAYVYTEDPDETGAYRREAEAAARLGLPADYTESVPGIDDAAAAVRFRDQAQFHPRSYLLALAEQFTDAGGRIFEETRAVDVDSGERPRVRTERGTVAADAVVAATHFPLVDVGGFFARMYPKRSYVLALRARDPPREAMLYREGTPYFSVRTHETPDGTLTLVGGQNHKTGHGGSTKERYRAVERAARRHFDVESVEYRWSTQDYVSVDGVPYVGRLGPFERNVYVATGFGGWGMSNGTAAGMMLSDVILDRDNDCIDAFDPLRATVRASARTFAAENANVARRFAGGWADGLASGELRGLDRDEATVRRQGSDVLGAYRDEDGALHVVDAVCPHMGCLVQWNDGERSWDCPCHGSRFDVDGGVLDGPATADLRSERSEDGERR